MAQWGLSSYLVVVRALQVLATLISAVLNGFLLVYIQVKALGLSDVMLALEIMVSTYLSALVCLGATRPRLLLTACPMPLKVWLQSTNKVTKYRRA